MGIYECYYNNREKKENKFEKIKEKLSNYIQVYFNPQIGLMVSFGKAIHPRKRYVTIEIPFISVQIYLTKY